MTNQDIIKQVERLEKMIPEMQASQKELHVTIQKSIRFIKYVKENHLSIFDRALEYAEKE